MITEELRKILEEDNHYFDLVEIPGRGICGLSRMVYTVGLCWGMDEYLKEGRWCYHTLSEARYGLQNWNGKGDPPGDWIKYKGRVEYSNPNNEQDDKQEKNK